MEARDRSRGRRGQGEVEALARGDRGLSLLEGEPVLAVLGAEAHEAVGLCDAAVAQRAQRRLVEAAGARQV